MGNPNIINQSTSFGTPSFAKTNNGYHNHHNPLQTIDEKERQAFEAIMDEFEEDFLKQEKEENDYNNSIMNKNDKPKIENADQNKTERAALHPNSRADSWTTLSSTKADSTSRTTSESSTRPHTALDVNDEEEGGGGGGHSKVKYNRHTYYCKAWRKIPNSCIRINEDIYSTITTTTNSIATSYLIHWPVMTISMRPKCFFFFSRLCNTRLPSY